MMRLLKRIEAISTDYSEFMKYQRARQLKTMMIASVVVVVYSVIAPGIFSIISPDVAFENLVTEFGILAGVCAITWVLCFLQIRSSYLSAPENVKKAIRLCEGTTLFLMIGVFAFDCCSLYFAQADGRGDTYFAFLLSSMLFISFLYLNPVSFTMLFTIGDILIILLLSYYDAVSSIISTSYNLAFFDIAVSMLMGLKFRNNSTSFQKTKKLDEYRKARERFLIQITHEMRTPLNAILGKNQVIARDTGDADIARLAGEIGNSGKIMLSLINDVIDLSKLESGTMSIDPADYSIAAISEEVASIMRSEAESHGLRFYMEIADNIPSVLYGDEVRIKQIIMNLLSNAIKYTRAGSVSFRIGFNYGNDDDVILHVSVSDTGIGIRPEELPRLTEGFVHIDDINRQGYFGTGLGLSITTHLLGLMGSSLHVESTYGDGSTFSFDITQKIIDHKPFVRGQRQSVHTTGISFTAPKARVLVVDDNPVNYSVCRSLMKYYGFVPEYANCGEACISRMKIKQYDVIFLDHFMPEMDGIETLNTIKREMPDAYANTPIIALTANTTSDAAAEYKRLGFSYFLAKPLDAVELETVLLEYLPESRLVRTEE